MLDMNSAFFLASALGGVLFASDIAGGELIDPMKDFKISLSDSATSPTTPIDGLDNVANDAFRAFSAGALSVFQKTFGQRIKGEVLLLRIPLVAPSEAPLGLPDLTTRVTPADCSIRSPWLDLDLERGEGPRISALAIWSERQLLLDANIFSAHEYPAPRRPYSQSAFEQSAGEYGMAISERTTEELLQNSLPRDLAELFRRAPQSTLIPFSANAKAEMQRIASASAADHVEIIERLAALCASGAVGSFRFSQVSDLPIQPADGRD